MLTRLIVKNFKRFDDATIELGKTVVFIGPNNSGKSTALQAIALWYIGLKRWNEKRQRRTTKGSLGKTVPEKRPAVAINRNDLISLPVPAANLLWRDLHVRNIRRMNGEQQTQNIRIDIILEGISNGKEWSCGLEFDYANEESFYCRPLRLSDEKQPIRMTVPEEASQVEIAFLPPMSGLAAVEPKWEEGRIKVLIGEGQTAQVLRNLCLQVQQQGESWNEISRHIRRLFGVELLPPQFIRERGEITMSYREPNGVELDLSNSGRGLQQTLLLLAHLFANRGTVLLLDEPDAHLEILRQRQIYQLISRIAEAHGSQIIAASHSEIVLNEAAGRDTVVAFVGKPHTLIDRGSQLAKSLTEIGFEQYYQAELKGWILYLEGPSDLSILQEFSYLLDHEAAKVLDDVFVQYVSTNLPQKARDHFNGLKEAKQDLVGIAIFDRLEKNLQSGTPLRELMWKKMEIENYLCAEHVLLAFAKQGTSDDLFGQAEADRRVQAMREAIKEVSTALRTLRDIQPWSDDVKASEDALEPIFNAYYKKLALPNKFRKRDYHELVRFIPRERVDAEIVEKLEAIVDIAKKANPRLH
jgi:predicted ATPase